MAVSWLLAIAFLAADPVAANAGLRADRQDLLLLLEERPVHVRLHLSLGGEPLASRRASYIHQLVQSLDANQDGQLQRQEASRSPLFRTKSRPGAQEFLGGLKTQSVLTRREVEQRVEVKGGGILSFHEEANTSATDMEVFRLLDRDNSGLLDIQELKAAAELIASKDADGDQCITFDEFLPPPPPPDPMAALLGQQPATQLARPALVLGEAGNTVFLARLLKTYDRDRDQQLERGELGWETERLKALDANGNGKVNLTELRSLKDMAPDAELSINLSMAEGHGGFVRLEATTGAKPGQAGRDDYARVDFSRAVMTFTERHVDSETVAVDDALRKLNALDADGNGYLTRDETADRLRFARELFELIDGDGDDKIFADEMREYVKALAEPAATSCRVRLKDAGHGFFLALDTNADGRISERERRLAGVALAQLDRDGTPGIRSDEPVRHFCLELTRGSFQLFGDAEQPAQQLTSRPRRQVAGPIWFQRMDRNNDGDLIWNEFLGPRWVFDQLDADGDELLDPREAANWPPKSN